MNDLPDAEGTGIEGTCTADSSSSSSDTSIEVVARALG
jgi:hypothetical protein